MSSILCAAPGEAAVSFADRHCDLDQLDHSLIIAVETAKYRLAVFPSGHWLNQVLTIYIGVGSLDPADVTDEQRESIKNCERILRAFVSGGLKAAEALASFAPKGTVPQPIEHYHVTRERFQVDGD